MAEVQWNLRASISVQILRFPRRIISREEKDETYRTTDQ